MNKGEQELKASELLEKERKLKRLEKRRENGEKRTLKD